MPRLLPEAPAQDVAAWNKHEVQWQKTHPNSPDYAPPEYTAYADVKIEPASSTPYRFAVTYHYDPASGTLTSVENAQTAFVYWQAEAGSGAMDAFGHLLGSTDDNNVGTVMTYDQATGAPTGISSGIGLSSAVQQLTYYWDGYGNLTKREDDNQNLGETFGYDDLNRLTSSMVTNPAGNGPAIGFGYDLAGNIQTKTVSGVTSTQRTR